MSDTKLEKTHKLTSLEWGNSNMNCSETKIIDGSTTAHGCGYSNDVTTVKEAIRERIEKFEYRKIALLNYRNDLMSKLAECADKISEIDRELRTISGTHGENKN